MRSPIQLLGACFILMPLAMKENAAIPVPANSSRLQIPVVKHLPALANNGADTSLLKSPGWYSNAVKDIEESEYRFAWNGDNKAWCTPNRHQGLRFYYNEEGFTVQPRTTQVPVNTDPMALPGKIKYRFLSDWKVQFELDKDYASKGYWQINGNKAEYITPAVIVQYNNNKDGMRQNFIVQKPLQENDELDISFSITTKLKVVVQDKRLQFFHHNTNVLNYQDLTVWDACGKPLTAYFKENKKGSYSIRVDTKDAVYPIIIDPVSTTPSAMLESNQANANIGISVSGAGDVNGDGYSDVIVGARGFSNPQSSEGAAFIYHGNDPGTGKRNQLRLYNSDLITPMQQSNFADPNLFGAGLYVKSPQGKQKGKLVWETVGNGNPFSGTPITNSVSFTTQEPTFTDLGLTGIELKHQIAKRIPAKATYIRARVKYDPVTSITGQVYGPWHYPAGFLQGRRDVGSVALPVKFIAFTVSKKMDKALLRWITAEETPGVKYEVQHSIDGVHFTTIQILSSLNNSRSEYEWVHADPSKGNNHYRVRATEFDKELFTAIRQLTFDWKEFITIYPVPVKSGRILTIRSKDLLPGKTMIQLTNMNGVQVKEYAITNAGPVISLSLTNIPSGQFLLTLKNQNNDHYSVKLMVIK